MTGRSREEGPRLGWKDRSVLLTLLDDPEQERHALELGRLAGLAAGTIHPVLARLERAEWLSSRWEQVNAAEQGRPRRRYYRLNPNSIALVRAALRRQP